MPLITDSACIKRKKGSFYLDLNEWQGAKKVSFTACHSSKLELACTSPQVISASPKTLFDLQDWLPSFCNLNFPKKFTCLSGKLRTEFTCPKAKSTSRGLSDTTIFECWNGDTRCTRCSFSTLNSHGVSYSACKPVVYNYVVVR